MKTFWPPAEADEEPEPSRAPSLDTPHIIMYTAGTTGRPKGAVAEPGRQFLERAQPGIH